MSAVLLSRRHAAGVRPAGLGADRHAERLQHFVPTQSEVYDYTTASSVYYSVQHSRSTPNESFALGDAGGDYANTLLGSSTGTLIAGHDYVFSYNAIIQAYPAAATASATATGSVSLSFMPVPEPTTGALMALGMALLGMRRRSNA